MKEKGETKRKTTVTLYINKPETKKLLKKIAKEKNTFLNEVYNAAFEEYIKKYTK
jgi:hypothetical protein